jgi:hypothetical protein
MGANASHHDLKVRNPGTYATPSEIKFLCFALMLAGLASFLFLWRTNADRAWSIYLVNHFFFMSLALGGIFFAAIQWITGAMWSAPVRRLAESFTAYLPIALLSLIGVCLALHPIYHHWMDHEAVMKDPILRGKSGYLNAGFFTIRNLVGFAILFFFSWKMVGNSVRQDSSGDYRLTLKNRVLTPAFLIFFAIGFTMMSFDQIMSLDPHWFSTIFGIYCFAGLFYSTLAMLAIFTVVLKRKGVLAGIVNENHLHDIGKFMFAFTVFWTYIAISQFLLIWYANQPEETGFYLKRMQNGGSWMYVSLFLLFGKFMVPFFALIRRDAKRNEKWLVAVAVFMLIAQWIDILWLVQPNFFKDGPRVGIFEIGVTLGFLGLFLFAALRFLSKNNVVAIGDPRLAESVHHHHQ